MRVPIYEDRELRSKEAKNLESKSLGRRDLLAAQDARTHFFYDAACSQRVGIPTLSYSIPSQSCALQMLYPLSCAWLPTPGTPCNQPQMLHASPLPAKKSDKKLRNMSRFSS